MITLGLSLSSHIPADLTILPPIVPPPPVLFSVSMTAPDGTVGTAADGGGDLTVTITDVTDPAAYNGVYAQDVEGNALTETMLDAGPQCLVAVAVQDDGTPAPGETLASMPGLWIYDSAGAEPTLTYQWFREGAAIAGATGATYTVQAADEGATLSVVETAAGSNGTRSATSAGVTVPVATSSLSVIQLADGTLEVVTDGSGDLTVTITDVTDPAAYNGVYAQDVEGNALTETMLDAGPQCLVAVAVQDDGTPAPGETLASMPGLWIYDSAGAEPTLTYQWFREGAAIAGATGATYTVQAADEGATLSVVETAAGSNGTRSATSAGTSVLAATSLAVTRYAIRGSTANTSTPTFNVDTSGLAVGDKLILASCQRFGAKPLSAAVGPNLGNAPQINTIQLSGGTAALAVFEYTLTADDISATLKVVITIAGSDIRHLFVAASVSGGTLGAVAETADLNGGIQSVTVPSAQIASANNCMVAILAGQHLNASGSTATYNVTPDSREDVDNAGSTDRDMSIALFNNVDDANDWPLDAEGDTGSDVALCVIPVSSA